MRATPLTLLGFTLLLGCHRSAAPGSPAAVAESARCAAVADSVAAAVSLANRALAVPIGRPRLPIPSRGAATAGEIRTTFAVRPDGGVDTATVQVTGWADPQYRDQMIRVLGRTRFRAPRVSGCPVGGRGDIQMRSETRVEMRRVG